MHLTVHVTNTLNLELISEDAQTTLQVMQEKYGIRDAHLIGHLKASLSALSG